MRKNGLNPAHFGLGGAALNLPLRKTPPMHVKSLEYPAMRRWRRADAACFLARKLGSAVALALVWLVMLTVLINSLFFPTCDRVTRDCFLVQNLWAEHGDRV